MSSKIVAAVAAATLALGGASLAQAGSYQTVDLSPYVNQSLYAGWSIDGFSTLLSTARPFVGVTTGNQGSNIPFSVALTNAGNSFWYGLDDGTGSNNLFAPDPNNPPLNSIVIPVTAPLVTSVYTLADNTFGRDGQTEFQVDFHGAGGDIVDRYVGGYNTKDYNTANCATTGCDVTPGATDWYFDGTVVYQQVQWVLPQNFGLTSMTFSQVDNFDGAILMGVSLGVPEPASWALMIGGFGLAGAALRRRRRAALA